MDHVVHSAVDAKRARLIVFVADVLGNIALHQWQRLGERGRLSCIALDDACDNYQNFLLKEPPFITILVSFVEWGVKVRRLPLTYANLLRKGLIRVSVCANYDVWRGFQTP